MTTVELAAAYLATASSPALPAGMVFTPLMTLYLTDNTQPAEIAKAAASGFVKAVKLYPAGATTNSDAGLTAIEKAYDVLAEMERVGLPLLVHGEVTDPAIDPVRPREGLHRHRAAAADATLPRNSRW